MPQETYFAMDGDFEQLGRGLHSSTFQLNLSRFGHKLHPKHPLITPDTAYSPPNKPYMHPLSHINLLR
jgi:hypothetical protein